MFFTIMHHLDQAGFESDNPWKWMQVTHGVAYEDIPKAGSQNTMRMDTGIGSITLDMKVWPNALHQCSLATNQRLYELYTGENLQNNIRAIADPRDRIRYVVDLVFDRTGLDRLEYLSQILTLDMLILNTDRHINKF